MCTGPYEIILLKLPQCWVFPALRTYPSPLQIGVPGTLTVLSKSKRGALNRKKNKGLTFQITRSESTASLVYYEAVSDGASYIAINSITVRSHIARC